MSPKKNATDGLLKELREFGLRYPGAHFKSPWPGHLDLAVNDKTFAYLSLEGEPLGISCKLPHSNAIALALPFTQPAAYGLGKSGWVSAKFPPGETPSIEMLKAWIDESYRAQAPKKLVKSLDAPGGAKTAPAREEPPAPKKASAPKKPPTPKKVPAPKKAPAPEKASAPKKAPAPRKAAAGSRSTGARRSPGK